MPLEHPRSHPPALLRAALRVLQFGGSAVVLAALPYPLFELDRYTFPKELILEVVAVWAGLLCLASARRITVLAADVLLGAFLLVSLISVLTAANGWLAFRAIGVSLAGAAVFWCGRAIGRTELRDALLGAIAAAVVLGALTALAQAYGVVTTNLASLTRAPGGTFGNRNFMAHLVTIGSPVLLLVCLEAKGRVRFAAGALGVVLVAAALVLSRSRAAWLGAGVCGAFLAVEGLWIGRLWTDDRLRRRVVLLAGAVGLGLALALGLPNKLNWRSESPYLDSLAGVANFREGSGRGRLVQYGNTLGMVADHALLGVGPGNWPVYYPRYRSPADPSFDGGDILPTNPWPSSDWIAVLAERGLVALLLLMLLGGSIALGAWARIRHGSRAAPALPDLAIAATLLAVAVVGAFDAVLLLPIPAFFVWTTIGALASTARPVREIPLTSGSRRQLLIGAGIIGTLFLFRSTAQTAAMGLYSTGNRGAMELASRLDPGSYRIHMLLGLTWMESGRCDRARPHGVRARELFPNHPAPHQILRVCGSGKRN